jgi:NAD(P)H-hydrate epimerase
MTVSLWTGAAPPFPRIRLDQVPAVTTDQMREVDRLMIEEFSIDLLQMMENAGRALATVVRTLYRPRRVEILAGHGSNGGGALVAARHLANRGVRVHVSLAGDAEPGTAAARQSSIARRMGIDIGDQPRQGDLIVDGLIGYGLEGDPRGPVAELVRWAARQSAPIVSLDVPTGVDATSGEIFDPSLRAASTVTLALPKFGLLRADAHVGRLFLADISVPARLYERLGIPPQVFVGDVIELIRADR